MTPNCYMPHKLLPSPKNLVASSTRRLSRLKLQHAMTDLNRHTTPLAFLRGTGVNYELDVRTESKSAVRFTVRNQDVLRGIKLEGPLPPSPYAMECEVVQSLAKWKRYMLGRLECPVGTGIYCDSTSIRKG